MFLTAFILGLAGSLHCAGMCSSLAYAVTNMSRAVWLNRVIYNMGRILTYGTLGAIVAALGIALPLEKFQTGLSIGMGVLLIAVAFLGLGKVKIKAFNTFIGYLSRWLKATFARQLQRKAAFSMFLLGAINGLLPCGLTFIALTACLILPSAFDGFYFMLLFGVGTFPVMLGLMSVVQILIKRFRLSYARVNAIMLIVAGSLLIAQPFWMHKHINQEPQYTEIEICAD